MNEKAPIFSDDKFKLLINSFIKSTDVQLVSMLPELKKQSDLMYLRPLLEILVSGRSEMLKNAIVEFVSDLKDQQAVPVLVEFLFQSFPSRSITKLVTACWQCRLDFSKHLQIFFTILLDGNYQTAFEAFTVIENSLDGLTSVEISEYIAQVKKGIINSDRDKQLLLIEMISVLDKSRREAL